MATRQANLQQDTYFRVMQLLKEHPDITQRELAERLGVSASGLNYCIRTLVLKGWVKVKNFRNSRNRAAYMYLLTPQGLLQNAVLTREFLDRKLKEYASLRAEIEALSRDVADDAASETTLG